MIVKQNMAEVVRATIRLRDHMDAPDGSGVNEGRIVHARLLETVEWHFAQAGSATFIFVISLKDVRRTDASFPRESVMQLAYRFRQQHGFCLWHLDDSDLVENWEAAADRRGQPILSWHQGEHGFQSFLLGPKLSEGLRSVFDLLLAVAHKPVLEPVAGLPKAIEHCSPLAEIDTADVAARLGLSISNTSNKLKVLWTDGYILRREQSAPTGGIEFRYFVPR